VVTDAHNCTVSQQFDVAPSIVSRTYDICFNWKTKTKQEFYQPPVIQTNTMSTLVASEIRQAISQKVAECVSKTTAGFEANLDQYCNNVNYLNDEMVLTYHVKQYHYTLYYYDRAGNLVRTVPPKGVQYVPDNQTQTSHNFVTSYEYNSLGQLVEQNTPDAATSQFIYNNNNQLRFSQNEQQYDDVKYSYTNYDALGRIIEVGQDQVPAGTQYSYS
jgi:YD repeat-containing protein